MLRIYRAVCENPILIKIFDFIGSVTCPRQRPKIHYIIIIFLQSLERTVYLLNRRCYLSLKKSKNTKSSTQHYYRNKQSNSNFTHNNYTNVTLSSYRIFARVLRQNVDSVPIPAEVSQFRQPKSANKYMGSYNDWLEIGDHY